MLDRKKVGWWSVMRVKNEIFMKRLGFLRQEDGLTLIELMVSMMIFLVVSAGIAGTLTTGLRTTVAARQSTFGKEIAQQRVEEMRSRPYYVQYSSDPTVGSTSDIDLLDIYYPNVNSTPVTDDQGWTSAYYSGSDAHYTRTSPPDIHGVVTTVETRFVDMNRAVVAPPSTYDSNSSDDDVPPSELVEVTVTTSWLDHSEQNSYVLVTLISSTGQAAPGGSGDPGEEDPGEEGCEHSSNSRVDVNGILLTASTGSATPYTDLVTGILGDAHANAVYSCSATLQTNATGGSMTIVGGNTYTGATGSITGPPALQRIVGPLNVTPPTTNPKPVINNSKVKLEIEDESGDKEVEAEGEAMIGTQSLDLQQVSSTPTRSISGYKRWDFINPTITVTGAGSGDDGEDIEAEIEQEDGNTEGEAEVGYQQINILPLQKWPTSTTTNPSAAQGLVFIRDFRAKAEAVADGTPGNAETSMTYSFRLGMFNPNKCGCTSSSTGDTCYDFYTITPSNPLQNVLLSNSNYRLQNALMTEWYSYTTDDIANAMTESDDGRTATITADALVKISAKFGTEIRWRTSNNAITLMSQQGLQKVWIGAIDVSVEQDG